MTRAPVGRKVVKGKADPEVVAAIELLQSQVQALLAHAQRVQAAGFLTKEAADAMYGPAVMQQALSANGSHPLNVSNLLGVLTQVQP